MNEKEGVVTEPRRRRSTDDLALVATEDKEPPKRGGKEAGPLAKAQKFLADKIKAAVDEKGAARRRFRASFLGNWLTLLGRRRLQIPPVRRCRWRPG